MLPKLDITRYLIIGAVALTFLTGLIGGSAFWGYTKGKNKAAVLIAQYREEIANQEQKLSEKQVEVVDRVVTEYVDRVKEITKTEYVYRDVINEVIVEVPIEQQCELTEGWVSLHDAFVLDDVIDQQMAQSSKGSGITEFQALQTIISNYTIARYNEQQLQALQKWVEDSYKQINQEELQYDQ